MTSPTASTSASLFDFWAEFLAINKGPGPAHQRHRNDTGFARGFRLAIGQQFWLEADGRLLFIHLRDNGQAPGRDIGGSTRLIKQQAPITLDFHFLDRSTETALAVKGDQASCQGLPCINLQFWIERGAHRKTALAELVLAVHLGQFAAHFLGEGFSGEKLGAEGARVDDQRLLGRLHQIRPG